MDLDEIKGILTSGLSTDRVEAVSEGDKLALRVVSEAFAGLSKVKRQQKVYSLLNDRIRSGEIHAITMETFAPEELAD
ncbi:MAG: BolA/IbaG family iron-sulfur metabolism protein [Gammaproteobacteria bacterium]|nr:BolA/IbaG family iron-sulfur metabolism protein [Gammaproteobacteria bacterium]